MGKVYDDWERLVEAVLRREKLRQLFFAQSVTSSDCSSVLDHDSLQLHAAKTTMVRIQEEVIRILTLNKQFFDDGYMSPPTCEPRQSMSSEVEECMVELPDPDTIPHIKAMFMELGSVICAHPPPIPSPDGGVHPLTRHVVSYVLCFEEYDRTVSWILEDTFWGGVDVSVEQSMLAAHLHSITSCLEDNIASISGLYDNARLRHVFLTNNIHYMVEMIGKSKMRAYFGDEWMTKGFQKSRSHAAGAFSKSNFLSKSTHKDSGVGEGKGKNNRARTINVVAKLMGLDSLPGYDPPIETNNLGSIWSCFDGSFINESRSSRPWKNSWKEPISPRWRNSDGSIKTTTNTKPAPWNYINDGTKVPQKPALRNSRVSSSKTAAAVVSFCLQCDREEIERPRVSQSEKDVRVLKEILEALQAKGLLKTPKEKLGSNFVIHKDHEDFVSYFFRR